MVTREHEHLLRALKRELEFLDRGGYRPPGAWRPSFIFEDSPTCLRTPDRECAISGCALLNFVPAPARLQPSPCRHIPLNEAGETLDTFYRTGTQEELESALRKWLLARIQELDQPS